MIVFLSALTSLIMLGKSLPLVDPGLFVISGVQTCGNGTGYCLLGTDCRLNQDFEADPKGHCSGLKGAFTPSAHFVCCTSPQDKNELQQPIGKPASKPQLSRPVLPIKPEQPTSTSEKPHQPSSSPPSLSLLSPKPESEPGKEPTGATSAQLTTTVPIEQNNRATENSSKPIQQPVSDVQQSSFSQPLKPNSSEAQQVTTTFKTENDYLVITSTTPEVDTETVSTGHQTITSPPDYVQVDTGTNDDDAENSIDWEGVKNMTEVLVDYCPPCNSQAVFSLEGSPLCLGTHLRHGWVLTSGSCALRIFRSGMIKVAGKYLQDPELVSQVKTIAVHEDYRPYTSNILHPEPNNIGLVLLSSEPKKTCSPCIPDKEDKFAGKLCSTTSNATALSMKISNQEKAITEEVCESVVETMQGEGTEDFYTVACDSNSDSRYNSEESAESGKGLTCRGYIAGVETGSGTGLAVFTKVSQFSDWIVENMMHQQRQVFHTD